MVQPQTHPSDPSDTPVAQSSLPERLHTRHWVFLAVILAVAAFLRFYEIGSGSLWMDEIWSLEIASGRGHAHDQLPTGIIQTDGVNLTTLTSAPAWWHVFSPQNDYTYPPLYNIALRTWMSLFGSSPAAVRGLSAIFSLGCVLLIFDVVRLLHRLDTALFAAAIMALAAAQIDFARETRCYAMLLFLALLVGDAIARLVRLGPLETRYRGLRLGLFALLLTHYLSAGVAAALFCFALIAMCGETRKNALANIVAVSLAVAIVWGRVAYWQFHHLPGPTPSFLRESQPSRHAQNILLYAMQSPTAFLAGEDAARSMPIILVGAIAAITIATPLLQIRKKKDLLFWIVWLCGTLGLIVLADLFKQTTMSGYIRYTILAAPAIYAVIATFDMPSRPILRYTLPAICVMLLIALSVQRIISPPAPKEDWQRAAARIDQSAKPGELLLFFNQDPWVAPGIWYMCLRYYSPNLQHPWLLLNDSPSPQLVSQLRSRESLWLITLQPRLLAPRLLPGWHIDDFSPISSNTGLCHMVRDTGNP